MCAIAGVIGLDFSDNICQKMLRTMLRRGPDASDHVQTEDCALLHARLAVVDPDGGKQPMTISWGKEEYTIVYNGELYNTAELRQALGKEGHDFTTGSDTEVALRAYIAWGEAALEKFNGIYAFAVWHRRERKLFLARDRIGVKPLFYMRHRNGLLFASEIKSILAYPTVSAVLDGAGAGEILLLGPGRTPGSGVFRGIMELEPGCCAVYQGGRFQWKRYWKLMDHEHTESFEETADHVRYLVEDAIRRQMIADVPIGTFLSGGLDSSIITAVCAKEMEKKNCRLPTFSVDYARQEEFFVPGKFQPNSDSSYIRLMQETLNTDHHWSVLQPDDLIDALEEATEARDLPGMADVDISLLVFCKQIKKDVTVALSGECADEIFGGYPWYRDPQVRETDGFPWAQNTATRKDLLMPWITEKIDPDAYIRQRYLTTCQQSDILPGTSPTERRMKEMMNMNFGWFMQTLLDRKDRMSMYWGLEVRVPFCDHRIAEYLYGVPWEFKDHQGMEKGLLRHAFRDLLPLEVLFRKKSPYPKTHDPRYLQLVNQRMQELFLKKDAPIFQIVNRDNLKSLLEKDMTWPWYGQLMQRPQTIAYFLQLDHWLRKYQVDFISI